MSFKTYVGEVVGGVVLLEISLTTSSMLRLLRACFLRDGKTY